MVSGNNNDLLLNLCNMVYLNHEKYSIAVLDNSQISQLNAVLESDTGNFNLTFPAPNMLVIYNDYFQVEYAHLPEPIVKTFENPEKKRERIIKHAREKEMIRQREQFKAIREKRALEARREELQSRVFEKMGVRLKVQKNILPEEAKKEAAIEITNKFNKQSTLKGVLKSKVFISIFLIIMLCVVAITIFLARERINSDLTKENIKGRVKSIKLAEYYAIEKFGEFEKGSLKNKRVFNYNDLGFRESVISYNSYGSLSTKTTYKYDKQGQS